jgi:transcriptional regulator with XRE-family HTH domain
LLFNPKNSIRIKGPDAMPKPGALPAELKASAAARKRKAKKTPRARAAPEDIAAATSVASSRARLASRSPVPGNFPRIGSRVHHARLLREMRMKDLAAAAGCSESLISKIENNRIVPSLGVLHRICDALNLALGELLAAPAEDARIVTRAGERQIVEMDSLRAGDGIRMERLVPYAKGHLIQGNIHVIAPGGSSDGTITHSGEEVGYVISGEIDLEVGGQVYRVRAGDSFCYRSDLPHGYRNRGKAEARVLFVNTPPSF